ncbi:LPXTG cell wall anchor domain-containing protein [Ligilactobacillus aviarius]|uniref:LPXTG cell wall anchor domain-containing protein n=1 Tax=Ligilactobacillus aviarius TaxID=1606 RepID=UPI0025A413E4|nr:LPXTG cell wall anchor domain-containing protein [Ligilactobacillus aviarius]MDM8278099.1 LPXTG cell wall anchor domain-containing protein [Ligilactobacillus aviarius]
MANHKNLKKVIAVSSMAAATMGAGAMVNADNVHQQPVSSQKSSISTKVSSESQSVKSSSKVVLKSSQASSTKASSAKAATSSVASSSSSAVASSTKQAAQPMNLAATVTPSMTSAQHDTIQNDINNVNNVINKYQSDHSLPVSMASSNFGTDLVTDALGDYTSGLATKEELQKDVQKVQGVLNDDKDALAKETNAHAKEIIQAQVKLDQDVYNLLSQAVNGNVSQASSSKASSQSSAKTSSQSSKKSESKVSSSKKASSSSKADNKKASSQSSAKASSQASKKDEANVTSAVNALKNDADKYQNSSDAITKSYAQEAQQWLSNVQTFANGKGVNGQSGLNDEINFFKNDMKSIEDTLNASWFKGNAQTKQIMQDQINADKAMLAYLTGQNQASSTSSKKNDVKASAKKASSKKAVKSNGVKSNAKVAAKAVKANHQATVSSKKAAEKHATANSAKKASMPQTGEANNAGILAGIGALAIAAAGAFLFRKRG